MPAGDTDAPAVRGAVRTARRVVHDGRQRGATGAMRGQQQRQIEIGNDRAVDDDERVGGVVLRGVARASGGTARRGVFQVVELHRQVRPVGHATLDRARSAVGADGHARDVRVPEPAEDVPDDGNLRDRQQRAGQRSLKRAVRGMIGAGQHNADDMRGRRLDRRAGVADMPELGQFARVRDAMSVVMCRCRTLRVQDQDSRGSQVR